MSILVFCAQGSWGDFNPLLSLAIYSARNNFKTYLFANDVFLRSVLDEQDNLFLVSTGTQQEYWEGQKYSGSPSDPERPLQLIKKYHTPTNYREFEEVKKLAKANSNVTIFRSNWCWGAKLAAYKYKLNSVNLVLAPYFSPQKNWLEWYHPRTREKSMINRCLDLYGACQGKRKVFKLLASELEGLCSREKIRRPAFGMAYDQCSTKEHSVKQIALYPDWFGGECYNPSERLIHTNFIFSNSPMPSLAKSGISILNDFYIKYGQFLLFASGSANHYAQADYSSFEYIVKKTGYPGVIVSPGIAKNYIDHEKSVAYVDFLDFDLAIPKAALVIHHGGVGTTAKCLKYGALQYLRPVEYDQFNNAQIVIGMGVALGRPFDRFDPDVASRSISALLASENAKRNVTLAKKRIADGPQLNAIFDCIT